MAEEVDRLSDLPLDIKTSILFRLPIDVAVRTSSLSHYWRHVWTHLSSLYFNLSFPDDPDSLQAWVEVVVSIISSLRGPVIDFDLCYYAQSYASLDLFRVLYLCHLHLLLPDDFMGFEHLQDLSLYGVYILQQDIQLLIDRSKNLKKFQGHVESDDAWTLSLAFNSPLLTYIQYYFTDSIKEVRVINAPFLEKANVSACLGPTSSEEDCASIAELTSKFMVDVATVSDLSLGFEILKCFSQDSMACALRVQFLQLRSLHLEGIVSCLDEKCFDHPKGLEGLVEPDAFKVSECIKKEDGISCLEKSLRRLTIFVTNSINIVAIGMLRFILMNANVIELVEIIYGAGNEVEPS